MVVLCEKANFYLLSPPATKLRQGNVFTSLRQEFCPHGGECVSAPACTTSHMTRGVSGQGDLCPGGSLSGGSVIRGVSLCPAGLCPEGSLSRGRAVPVQGGLCLGYLCPEGVFVRGREGLCPRLVSVRGISVMVTPRKRPPYGNEWALRILLECILVTMQN